MKILNDDEALEVQLEELRRDHRALDAEIALLNTDRTADALTIRRLKKRKLSLKDQIARIEEQLYPDIIA